jgi:hypothetical protein
MKKGTRNNIILWFTISFVILLFPIAFMIIVKPGPGGRHSPIVKKDGIKVKYAAQRKRAAQRKDYAAIAAVKQTITIVSTSDCVCRTGFLEDGVAVLVKKNVYSRTMEATYWVQSGRVYAANGVANMWSPSISYSKAGIDYDSVEKAVSK